MLRGDYCLGVISVNVLGRESSQHPSIVYTKQCIDYFANLHSFNPHNNSYLSALQSSCGAYLKLKASRRIL